MNSSNNAQIKINPKDLQKISPELILNITLKDGSIIILDESIPSQDINKLLINNKNENNNEKNKINNMNNNKSININIYKSYTHNLINGKRLEMNDSGLINQNNYNKEFLDKSNSNNANLYNSENVYNNNDHQNIRLNNFRSQNQTISDFVTEKFQRKFRNSLKRNKKPNNTTTTINSEININIQGNNSKQNYSNNLLKDFDELLLNFNDKKKGLNNQNINGSKKKYKYYKRLNQRNNNRLLLSDLSGISPNTKAIKYIGRNEHKNSVTTTHEIIGNNNINHAKRLSFLKEKAIKRTKSNNYCLIKNENNKIIHNIISPPNYLHYNKLF